MKRFIGVLIVLSLATSAHASAGIVAAWNNYSCATGKACTGPAINSAKQGTNNAYWGGTNGISVGFDKTGSKDTITISGPQILIINATVGNQTQDIILFSRVTVCKSDATANTVAIIDSTPRTIPVGPLSVQGECVNLALSAGIWYVQ